jgi:hypothetical protein
VVVVAELFSAEADAAAAAAVGEDVAALVAFWLIGVSVWHVFPPPLGCLCKVFKRNDLGSDFGSGLLALCELNAKARLLAGLLLFCQFYFTGLSETTMPTLSGLFCLGYGVWGLDMRFCWVFGVLERKQTTTKATASSWLERVRRFG